MFSKIPPFIALDEQVSFSPIIKVTRIYHSTVSTSEYRSEGIKRKNNPNCIFHYTIRGHGEVIHKGRSFITSAGEGFLNILNEEGSGYGYPQGQTEEWEIVVIEFEGDNVRKATEKLLEKQVVYSINNREVFWYMCNRLIDFSDKEIQLTFFPKLVSMLFESKDENDGISTKFREIVERDLAKNPTISAIAFEMNVSREHLQREFSKQFGKTPAKYLSDKRFERLCMMLQGEMKDDELVKQMNFSSKEAMVTFFKKYSGVTPRQYRKKGGFFI